MNKNLILNIAVAIFAVTAIICISVTITILFRPLYYMDIDYLNIADSTGMSYEDVKLNYDTLIDYNVIGGPSKLRFPDFNMSIQGKIHFEEVKDIFIAMQVISIIAVLLFIIWAAINIKGKRTSYIWMKLTAIVAAAVSAVVGCAVVIDWNWAFTMMHKIFFRNDYWIFSEVTDPVIKILPDGFFFHCGIMIIVLILLQIVALQFIYRRLKNERNDI